MSTKVSYDVLTIGRSSIDLYSNDIGHHFEDISSFNAYVGGSPTNIAIACSRLGLSASLLTGFGEDKVGDFIKKYLTIEGVDYQYSPTLKGARSSAVLLGIQPPDTFPLVYYRDNAADLQINIYDVESIDFQCIKIVEISGTALSREPSRSAVSRAAHLANQAGCTVVLDLDYRHDQWQNLAEYQKCISVLYSHCDYVIGTEEEVLAASICDEMDVQICDQQVSNPQISGDIDMAIKKMMATSKFELVIKTGAKGAIHIDRQLNRNSIPGFPVDVLNILGAGDAFAAGMIYGLVQQWNMLKSLRFANACGAILVTQHGCANFMPTLAEVYTFIDQNGGW